MLDQRRIVVGVTGGIAAYKSPELVRRLRERGAEVRVVMTSGARAFITPLTFQAVSGHPVHEELLDARAESGMGHIELARWAELVVIAPATANCIARLAGGWADELLTTLCLATSAPLVIAPAMNQQMWAHPATAANVATLRSRGTVVLGPGSGDQACGEVGPGRMLEAAELADSIAAVLRPGPGLLEGLEVLVTAGPTWEAIDPVRIVTNLSSGKMGYAVAEAARAAGARVTLVSGPTALSPPAGVAVRHVRSAQQMHEAVQAEVGAADVFIGVAAVSDYRPAREHTEKIKKNESNLSLELERTTDILASVAARPDRPFTVGFAAETNDVEAYARDKLVRKGLDMIAANDVGAEETPFGADHNRLLVIDRRGSEALGPAPKLTVAASLIERIARAYASRHSAQDPGRAAR